MSFISIPVGFQNNNVSGCQPLLFATMDICGPEVVLGDIKHDVGLPETNIVFELVTDVDEKSEVRRCIDEKTPDSVWSVPSDLSLLPSQRGKTNVLVDGHRYNLQRKGKEYDKWRCAQYNKRIQNRQDKCY